MRIDPEVSRRKYESETRRLVEQQKRLEERGIFFLASSSFPLIDFLLVPRHLLRLAVPAIAPPGTPPMPPNTVQAFDVPSVAGRAFKARFDLSDYDLRAPSLEFRDPWTNELLTYENMFKAFEFEPTRGAHLVLLGDHPTTHKPFLCLRGIREYHEHPQHSGDDWLLYRDKMSIFSLILSLWRVAIDLVRPQLFLTQGQPVQTGDGPTAIAMQMQVLWAAEPKL
jgi:hypothetical protein